MEWILLIISGILEAVFAINLKGSQGFTQFLPGLICIAAGVASVYLLSLSLRVLSIGSAYAIWTGMGSVITVLAGIMFFRESADLRRIASILAIVVGIVCLRLTEGK
jgi:quaternary ammonium compound-resistance protein SugE